MIPVGLTQRVGESPHGERRDQLDQRWAGFLAHCGLLPVALPNDPAIALALLERLALSGVILTGGNDLAVLGGDAPERDATEAAVLEYCRGRGLPVLGVCRGLQFLQHHCGGALEKVAGHVGQPHRIRTAVGVRTVNSFHHWGCRTVAPGFDPWAWGADGSVEAMAHRVERLQAILWHPERENPPVAEDVALLRSLFLPKETTP